ncbi:MAG: ATP-dependent metallopeptidase FtsH/Yme1/Tma family protein [Cyanobacteria bacterium SIG29]|nr:ATP-dependent metallopeptidase FtsH/Yme1/Tma family protein [Cyanobacteria bacterium SIG29]
MNKNQSMGIWLVVGILVLALASMLFAGPTTSTKTLSYTEFLSKVKNSEIKEVVIENDTVTAVPVNDDIKTIIDGKETVTASLRYKANIPVNDTTLYPVLSENNVNVEIKKANESSSFMGLMGTALPILVIIVFFIILAKMVQSGGSQALSFGKSKAKMMLDSKVKITFKDVAGIDEEKQELEEIVDFLKNGEKYMKLGAKIPKGVLLVGAPGTGKTLMAKAVAGEAGVPFFSISGSDFVEMFVGVGASRVRDLFEQAKKHQPCIVFIDEIDAVGRQRGAGLGGGHDEREQTLNQLLVEMDGFDGNTNIIILAATNRPDILDNALLRPGRFDRQIMVSLPDVKGREQILNVHAKGKPLDIDVDLKVLAKRTPGFTGADLQSLLNESALLAARKNKAAINMEEVDAAIDRVIAGIEKKSKVMTDEDKEITSYHEVGHALLAKLLKNCDELHKVTIIPRGYALGITWTRPEDNKVHVSKAKLLDQITMTLGGRVAEEIVYGVDKISTGASSDIEKVTSIAKKMVSQWGMSEKMGAMTYGKSQEHVFMGRDFGTTRDFSEEFAADLDREIKRIIDERYEVAKQLLSDNRDLLDAIAKELLEKETLEDADVTQIIANIKGEEFVDKL